MIKAIMFDLDGTLVQSEKLKAQSYAIGAQRVRGLPEPDIVPSRRTARSWARLGRSPPATSWTVWGLRPTCAP